MTQEQLQRSVERVVRDPEQFPLIAGEFSGDHRDEFLEMLYAWCLADELNALTVLVQERQWAAALDALVDAQVGAEPGKDGAVTRPGLLRNLFNAGAKKHFDYLISLFDPDDGMRCLVTAVLFNLLLRGELDQAPQVLTGIDSGQIQKWLDGFLGGDVAAILESGPHVFSGLFADLAQFDRFSGYCYNFLSPELGTVASADQALIRFRNELLMQDISYAEKIWGLCALVQDEAENPFENVDPFMQQLDIDGFQLSDFSVWFLTGKGERVAVPELEPSLVMDALQGCPGFGQETKQLGLSFNPEAELVAGVFESFEYERPGDSVFCDALGLFKAAAECHRLADAFELFNVSGLLGIEDVSEFESRLVANAPEFREEFVRQICRETILDALWKGQYTACASNLDSVLEDSGPSAILRDAFDGVLSEASGAGLALALCLAGSAYGYQWSVDEDIQIRLREDFLAGNLSVFRTEHACPDDLAEIVFGFFAELESLQGILADRFPRIADVSSELFKNIAGEMPERSAATPPVMALMDLSVYMLTALWGQQHGDLHFFSTVFSCSRQDVIRAICFGEISFFARISGGVPLRWLIDVSREEQVLADFRSQFALCLYEQSGGSGIPQNNLTRLAIAASIAGGMRSEEDLFECCNLSKSDLESWIDGFLNESLANADSLVPLKEGSALQKVDQKTSLKQKFYFWLPRTVAAAAFVCILITTLCYWTVSRAPVDAADPAVGSEELDQFLLDQMGLIRSKEILISRNPVQDHSFPRCLPVDEQSSSYAFAELYCETLNSYLSAHFGESMNLFYPGWEFRLPSEDELSSSLRDGIISEGGSEWLCSPSSSPPESLPVHLARHDGGELIERASSEKGIRFRVVFAPPGNQQRM